MKTIEQIKTELVDLQNKLKMLCDNFEKENPDIVLPTEIKVYQSEIDGFSKYHCYIDAKIRTSNY